MIQSQGLLPTQRSWQCELNINTVDFTGEAEQNCFDVSTKVRMWLFDERLTTDLMA